MDHWYIDELSPRSLNQLFLHLMRGYKFGLSAEMSRNKADGGMLPITFTLMSLGAYLSPGERSNVVDFEGERLTLDAYLVQAIQNGTDPSHPGYWSLSNAKSEPQLALQGAMVAFGAYLARGILFRRLTNQGIQNLEQWLENVGKTKIKKKSYHVLAHALNQAARKGMGLRFDESSLGGFIEAAERCYLEEGWFVDGGAGSHGFDDSVSWGYTALISGLLYIEGGKKSPYFAQWQPRIQKVLRHFPYLVDAKGAVPEFAVGGVGALSWLAGPVAGLLVGLWPHKAGVLKRMLRLTINRMVKDGYLSLESGRFHYPPGEESTAYHSLFSLGFLLLLPENSPFWKAKEEQLPAERGDFVRYVAAPGWLMHGSVQDGQVQLLNGGSSYSIKHGSPAALTRAGKFSYASRMGLITAMQDSPPVYACDNTLSASKDKQGWSHRKKIISSRIVGERVLHTVCELGIAAENGSAGRLKVDSLIVPLRSGAHIRIHRIRRRGLGGGQVHLREGGFALGIDENETPKTSATGDQARAEGRYGFSLVRILTGYGFAAISQGYEGLMSGHSLAPRFLLPRAEAVLRPGETLYTALYINGATNSNSSASDESLSFSRKGDKVALLTRGKSFFEFDFQSA